MALSPLSLAARFSAGMSSSPATTAATTATGKKKFAIAPVVNPYTSIINQARQTLMTPAQQAKTATTQVNANIGAQLGASNASSLAEQQQFKALQDRAQGFALAMASFADPTGQKAAADYTNAANTIGTLGTGLTGAVATDQQQALDAAKAGVAQTLNGQGQVTAYDPAGLRSTNQLTGVTIPGSTLAEQAANAAIAARGQGLQDAGQVGLIAKDYASQAMQALNQRAAERASIIAQRPDLYQTAIQAQRQDEAATQARVDSLTGASATYGQNQTRIGQAAQQLAQSKLTADRTLKQNNRRLTDSEKQVIVANARQKHLDELAAAHQTTVDNLNYFQIHHIDPTTGEVQAGWMVDPSDKTGTRYITTAQYLQNKQYYDGLKSANTRTTIAANAGITKAKIDAAEKLAASAANAAKLGTYNPGLSAQAGILVDGNGRHFKNAAGGNIPFDPKAPGAPKVPGAKANSGISATLVSKAQDIIDKAYTIVAPTAHYPSTLGGGDGTPTAEPGTGHPRESYRQTLNRVLALDPGNAAWAKRAKALANASYQEGQGGRPFSGPTATDWAAKEVAKQFRHGRTAQQAYDAIGQLRLVDQKVLLAALAKKYGNSLTGFSGVGKSIFGSG